MLLAATATATTAHIRQIAKIWQKLVCACVTEQKKNFHVQHDRYNKCYMLRAICVCVRDCVYSMCEHIHMCVYI